MPSGRSSSSECHANTEGDCSALPGIEPGAQLEDVNGNGKNREHEEEDKGCKQEAHKVAALEESEPVAQSTHIDELMGDFMGSLFEDLIKRQTLKMEAFMEKSIENLG